VNAPEVAEQSASEVAPVATASLHQIFLNHLLRPQAWLGEIEYPGYFAFRSDNIIALVDEAITILKTQSTLIRIDTPLVKVFGDIHGQYQDIMRFFHLWGSPDATSDVEPYEYLFLGDYVDRGNHSLETICMLIALKIKYPDRIHLIRGNHEDRQTNAGFGFYDECQDRLCEDSSA
jgi:protein phosphatase